LQGLFKKKKKIFLCNGADFQKIPECVQRIGVNILSQKSGPLLLLARIAHHTPNLTLCNVTSYINMALSA
jgi:hypothetical protein